MADRRIEWSDAARDDLRAIVFHIAKDSPDDALDAAGRLERRAAALAELSTRGRIVPELRRVGERRFRELIESPWRILYLVEGVSVYVVAVVDSRRDLQDWLREQVARFRMAKP
ncbi:MAG: type II toxin-antitoxin system RelE/ParE family toxin [Lysobacter sp.]